MRVILKIVFIFFLVSCNKTENSNELAVKLTKVTEENIAFDKRYYSIRSGVIKNRFPDYYESLIKTYKGIPENDSFAVTQAFGNYNKFLYDLFKNKLISKDKYAELDIDSLEQKENPEIQILTALIYFNNKQQFVIVDADDNKDFSNDKVNKFERNFKGESRKLNTYNFKFWFKKDAIIYYNHRKIIIDTTSIYNYNVDNNRINPYGLSFKYTEHWEGNFTFNNQKFNVAIQGYNPYFNILIKPNYIPYSKSNYYANENFSYTLGDTISLVDSLFVLSKIDKNLSSILLKKIPRNNSFKSYKTGNKLDNYLLKDLNGRDFNLFENDAKYTLIDFWGTWCKPCKEALPELKRIKERYVEHLNIVGIAYDKNIDEVKEYVKENDLTWKNSFFNRENKVGIIRDLNITKYPTFMLLDNNGQIIFKGSGSEVLKDIEKIMKSIK